MSLTLNSSLYFNSCLNLTASSPGTKHIISNVTKKIKEKKKREYDGKRIS